MPLPAAKTKSMVCWPPKRTVLLVDEAHLMPDAFLEDLRLLAASDFDRKSPFVLVLVGQPLLRERLGEPGDFAGPRWPA